jgi:uncharacterized protein involved in exopolysaccharide biosynthesis
MREHDLRIESLEVSPLGRTTAFRIACEYPDREKAWFCAEELVLQFVDSPRSGSSDLEVLDVPSLPGVPSAPNRLNLASVGLFVGLLVGFIGTFLRRPVSLA